MVGLGCLEGALMINETMLMMIMALNFGFGAYILMKMDSKNTDLSRMKSDFEKSFRDLTIPTINLDSLKDDLMDMVEDLIQNMRVPTALDHMAGIASQIMQMRSMKAAQELGLMPSLEGQNAEDIDND
jgi:Tfp pilus assembly protein PilO